MTSITLRGITWDHPRGYGPLAASIEPYARDHGVQVAWDKRSLKDFGDAPIDVLAQMYDVLIIDHPHVGLAAASGCLVPLDTWISADTLATLASQSAGPSHNSYFYAGHQWGLAIDAAMQASAYRPDLLGDNFLPSTWDAVLTLGEKLRKSDLYIAIPLVPTDAICSFLSLCASKGSPVGSEPGVFVDRASGLDVLNYLAALASVSHPDSLSWNPILMLDHMSADENIVYCPLTFCYTNYSRAGFGQTVYFTDIPGVRGALLGGTGFAVSARCAHMKEACDYGVWLCSADVQRTFYVENGGQPGNDVAWNDESANRLTHNFFRNTHQTLQQSYVRPRHDGFVTFQVEAGNIIHRMLRQSSGAEACFAELEALYRANQGY